MDAAMEAAFRELDEAFEDSDDEVWEDVDDEAPSPPQAAHGPVDAQVRAAMVRLWETCTPSEGTDTARVSHTGSMKRFFRRTKAKD